MSIVLFISTLVSQIASIVFAATYIWLNVFSKYTSDIGSRNRSILKIITTSMILSFVFALLSCLLTSQGGAANAVGRTALLYSIIGISWLVVLLGCGISMFLSFVSESKFKEESLYSIKKVFIISIIGACLGMILAWLLG